ncbi:nucleotidyltransferase domain-containing protein [bacterium]|jgi:predicted nucleotidyltransferase|nr:nucleotidyltransferase domain-containing protein [bacterium]|tara:strand:+ start:347 stop:2587 length:2241 start_codon:yes stop_codon:yes gene_type:complete
MDGNREKIKKKMKTFKESIIDIPRKTYAKAVFDDADTNNPKIKPSVKALIDKQIEMFEEEYPVVKVGLIGSILTKRYRADADLDLNVLFKVPQDKREEERVRLSKKYLSTTSPDSIQGKNIPGTQHPINFYFITDIKTYNDQEKKADAVFDIENNKFIKRPDDFTFDKSIYIKDFERKVQEIDVVKGELKRDIIDYDELKELQPDDILNLQELINDKLEEIEDSIEDIIKIGDGVDAERRAAFDTDMSPDEIRKYGIKNRLPKNVVYKMLEKYHYLKFFKKCKAILDDGEVTDAEVDSLKEAKGKSVAFTWGRFNPPTIGHEKVINKVKSQPTNDYKIFLSRSNDPKKNPLSPKDKLSIMKKMFPSHARNIEINQTNMILDIATMLYKKGYSDVTMVAGSDRVREFETMLTKYNGVSSRHGMYNFDNIKVVSAGERDPDADGASGMSASKMRAAAAKGDIKSFEKGLPRGADADGIMKQVRKGMNLTASYMYMRNLKPVASLEQFEQQQIRDLYIRDQIFNIGDTVDYIKEDLQGKVVRKGTNFIVVEDTKNNLHKAWIWDCIPVSTTNREAEMREHNLNVDYGFEAVSEIKEDMDAQPQDKDVKKKDGTQPKKYYKDLKKGTKDKRADHFKNKDTTKNDNKPAPGDKDAKTKPSIHTKKYKQMYGEVYEIGTPEYTKHTVDMTPGQVNPIKKVKGFLDREKETPSEKDIKEWASTESTMNKYRHRYKETWKAKLHEVVAKMIEKL